VNKPSFLKSFLLILLGILCLIGVLLGYAVIDRRPPSDVIQEGFDAYIRIESAGKLLKSTLDLEVADIVLASSQFSSIRGTLTSLRQQDFIHSPLFDYLADIRVDAAHYEEDFLIVGDLGVRSAATRAASPFYRLVGVPWIPEINYIRDATIPHFEITNSEPPLYAVAKKNLIIASNNRSILFEALSTRETTTRNIALDEALNRASEGDVRLLVNPNTFLDRIQENDEELKRVISLLSFSEYATVDVSVSSETLKLNSTAAVSSENPAIARLIAGRSGAPAIISMLPADTQYASILSAGTPQELSAVIEPVVGSEYREALADANQTAKAVFGADLEELVYSWTGEEMGVLGLATHPEPVFFIRVKDEHKRRNVFDQIFLSAVINRRDNTIIDKVRLTQISFPWFVNLLLESLDIVLPEPYMAKGDDFLFLSNSAEAVASTISSIKSKSLLIRTRNWEKSGGGVSASSAMAVIYSLDRSVPFFLQSHGGFSDALKLYRRGVATLRFDGGKLKVSLAAVASGGDGIMPMPGFPIKANGRHQSATEVLRRQGAGDLIYWMERDNTLVEYNASTGIRLTATLDDEATLTADAGILWAVSKRGNIYAFSPGLNALPGFPIVTAYTPSAGPVAYQGILALPERESRSLVLINRKGERFTVPVRFDNPLLSPPSYHNGLWAVYPKGFLASLHVFDSRGNAAEGWPVSVDQIAYGSPLLVDYSDDTADDYLLVFLTQAGLLRFYHSDGSVYLEKQLDGVFYTNPIWARTSRALYALADSGKLYRISLDGDVEGIEIKGIKAKDGRLAIQDVQGDADEEVFVSEAGAAIYGYTGKLLPLEGFPIAGGRYPSFADLNGDDRIDLVTGGFDGKIHAYTFR